MGIACVGKKIARYIFFLAITATATFAMTLCENGKPPPTCCSPFENNYMFVYTVRLVQLYAFEKGRTKIHINVTANVIFVSSIYFVMRKDGRSPESDACILTSYIFYSFVPVWQQHPSDPPQ